MTSVEVLQTETTDWDRFVQGAPDATFCHLAAWRTVMSEVLKHECLFLQARSAVGHLQGVLPLVRVRSRMLGHYLISLPFLNYGGPVGTVEALGALVERAVDEASEGGVDLLELRTRESIPSTLPRAQRKITVLLPLPDSPDQLWKGFASKLRSQVRRPRKEGMTVRFGPRQLRPFYDVFARNMRDLGTPVLPRAFFESLANLLPDHVVFGAVFAGNRPVAAGCGFVWRDEFELTWASSLRELNRLAPNMLLYWSLMEHAIERGLKTFNFGRCTPGGGTHRFKRQWGGIDQPLPWLQWSDRGVTSPPNPNRASFRLARALWSHLPLGVANQIGPHLARVLP